MSAIHEPPAPLPPVAAVSAEMMADLLRALGDISANRVRLHPYPGTATEADAVAVNDHDGACELVGGRLVDCQYGLISSFLRGVFATFLTRHVLPRRGGMVLAGGAHFRMASGNLRSPGVSFSRRDRLPRPLPDIGGWCPDLCAEVLDPGHTRAEMAMKRAEYFASGCRLVWEIDPRTRTAAVYTDATTSTTVDEAGTLDGGDVLPRFTLPLRDLFAQLDALTDPAP